MWVMSYPIIHCHTLSYPVIPCHTISLVTRHNSTWHPNWSWHRGVPQTFEIETLTQPSNLVISKSGDQAIRWSGVQVIRWTGDMWSARLSGDQVFQWAGDQAPALWCRGPSKKTFFSSIKTKIYSFNLINSEDFWLLFIEIRTKTQWIIIFLCCDPKLRLKGVDFFLQNSCNMNVP